MHIVHGNLRKYGVLLIPGFVSLMFMNCTPPGRIDSGEAGKTISRVIGAPDFDIESTIVAAGDSAAVEVFVGLDPASLTYVRTGNGYTAEAAVTLRIQDRESEETVTDEGWPEVFRVPTYAATQSASTVYRRRLVPAPPGSYILEVSIEDVQSAKTSLQRQAVRVPDLRSGKPSLSRTMLARGSSGDPVIKLHLPAGPESFRARTRLLNAPTGGTLRVVTDVVRYMLDSSAALPPHYFTSMGSWTDQRRLYPERSDTVLSVSRTQVAGGLTTVLEDTLPVLGPGVYQIVITVQMPMTWSDEEEEAVLTTGRFLVLMHPGFPRPVTIDDLIDPLVYIASQNEFRDLSAAGESEERRRRFEDFWLSAAGDRQSASRLIKRYYSRVEEANAQFSSVKEGWKTDRGMLYVVLGPPDRVDRLFDKMTWYYSLRGSQAENTFSFRRVLFAPENLQLEDYYLLRGQVYEIFWQRMVARWRDGEIH